MGRLLPAVASDRVRVESGARELVVEQNAGPCAALAVDVAQPRAGEVGDVGEAEGIAGRDQQPLLAVNEPDDGDLASGQYLTD